MRSVNDLSRRLRDLDGSAYPAYKVARGAYEGDGFRLLIDHVQGDPFAEPSRLRAIVDPRAAALPPWALENGIRRRAAADFLNRRLYAALARRSGTADRPGSVGSGRSGELSVLRPGQEVLERSSLRVGKDGEVEARFRAGLPARGRRIVGRAAAELVARDVPAAIDEALRFGSLDATAFRRHLEVVEDAAALRVGLEGAGLVGFVADGAVLPRRSGIDDRPLESAGVVPFRSPDSLRVTLEAPHAGEVSGMGIPAGVTLIVGGGYHGKSTLLRALERGVYDHVPGDGRERVVCDGGAVKVRAEDGRRVAGTDISNFIGHLPGGEDTRRFFTDNASGSTSQAAAIAEALEVGATCLLLDEDTSATNFMIRDARMQALVADELEPITPFIDRARQLVDEQGVSTILVVGGSGDYFDVADRVIAMKAYLPADVTDAAKRVAAERPTGRRGQGGAWRPIYPRVPLPRSLDPSRGRRRVHIKVFRRDRVAYGEEEISLAGVEQIVESAQARAIAQAIAWARGRAIDGRNTLAEALALVMAEMVRGGVGSFHAEPVGELAAFRIYELAAFVNRLRKLEIG